MTSSLRSHWTVFRITVLQVSVPEFWTFRKVASFRREAANVSSTRHLAADSARRSL